MARHDPGPDQSQRCCEPEHRTYKPGGQDLPAQQECRDPLRPAARTPSTRETCLDGGRGGSCSLLRLWTLPLSQSQETSRTGHRNILLTPEAGEPSGGSTMERCFRHVRADPRASSEQHKVHRTDREHPRRIRDGRDPPRTAGPHNSAQLWKVGLYLQLHQEARVNPDFLLPYRALLAMTKHFLTSCALLL